MAQQKIYSTIINGDKIYVKAYRKVNAIRFFNKFIKKPIKITKDNVNVETNIDPLTKIYDELYPKLIQTKKVDDKDNKYYNMFK